MGLHEEISELEQRFAESPDSRLFLPLADALRRAGELERAVKLCRDGLERFPDFNSARVLLGECLADLGELDEAGGILREIAEKDSGNRRIADRLADIQQKIETGEVDAELETVSAEPEAVPETDQEPEFDAPAPEGQPGAGEMFITHTLGDIYKMQGHDRKAFEVYSKLAAEGKADQEVESKLSELASRLGEQLPKAPKSGKAAPAAVEVEGAAMLEMARAGGGEGRFEERIDTIFHYLLGDSPDHAELGRSTGVAAAAETHSGSGEFVDMLEEWIEDIRQGK